MLLYTTAAKNASRELRTAYGGTGYAQPYGLQLLLARGNPGGYAARVPPRPPPEYAGTLAEPTDCPAHRQREQRGYARPAGRAAP